MKPFPPGVPQDTLMQATCGAMMTMNHASMPMGRTEVEALAIVDLPRQHFDGLSERISRVATNYVEAT